jgi:hypothetical protein
MGQYGSQTKWALELNAPLGQFVLKSELIYIDEGTRELDTASKNAVVRTGSLYGYGFYARMSYFVFGDPLINGLAGMQLPPHVTGEDRSAKTADALQLLVEYDHLGFVYAGDNGGATNAVDPLVGAYLLDVYSVGINYWFTKRVRVTGNFLYNVYSGSTAHPLSGPTSYELTGRIALAL